MTKKLIGYAPVDSGQLIVIDPCYLAEWKDGEAYPKRGDKDYGNHYAKCCEVSDEGGEVVVAGVAGAGVASRTAYGDGRYPVYRVYDKKGELVRLEIGLR